MCANSFFSHWGILLRNFKKWKVKNVLKSTFFEILDTWFKYPGTRHSTLERLLTCCWELLNESLKRSSKVFDALNWRFWFVIHSDRAVPSSSSVSTPEVSSVTFSFLSTKNWSVDRLFAEGRFEMSGLLEVLKGPRNIYWLNYMML